MSERERQWERTFHGPLTRALEAISTATPGRISIHGVVARSLAVDPDWWASMQEVCAEAAALLREPEREPDAWIDPFDAERLRDAAADGVDGVATYLIAPSTPVFGTVVPVYFGTPSDTPEDS